MPDQTLTLAPRAAAGTPPPAAPPIEMAPTSPATNEPVRAEEHAGVRDVDDPDRYEQITEHARGGLGRILRAVDKRLGRTVAVKELLRRGSTPADEARFLREALITARLEHPGIVPVHEAGRWPNGDPYYVMKLVEGRTLKEAILARGSLRERMGLLEHVIAIADAVGYAHKEGVIHRDLKPSNVIVGEFGETIVVDWGLARDRKQDLPEPQCDTFAAALGSGVSTVSGKVVGTPAYMAPEQARGECVDERADVYAIGAVLYELLAGAPPHHDDTPQGTLDRVLAGPPRPLPLVVPHVPSELATIVAKAMARQPSERYSHAGALAEDLRRFQCGKLVSAHHYSAWSILRKKLAQHRGVVAMAIASAIALGGVGVESFRRVVVERNIARTERESAIDARGEAEHRQRELVLLQAVTSLRKDPTATLAWLRGYEIDDAARAHVLDVVDEAEAAGVARHVFRPGDWVWDAKFTPDGQTLVAAIRSGAVVAYDLRTGQATELGTSESGHELLAMSPHGDFVITAGVIGDVMMWPLHGGKPRLLARGHRPVASLDISDDGKRVLVAGESGSIDVCSVPGGDTIKLGGDVAFRTVAAAEDWSKRVTGIAPNQVVAVEGEVMRPLARLDKAFANLAISPRGETVLIHDGTTVWSVPFTGGVAPTKLTDYDDKLVMAAWSPDGRTIALAGALHDVILVDVATGARRELRGHTDALYTVQWTRDGHRLLSASDDSTARIWNVADGTSQVLRGHDDDVNSARFSPDEQWVATSSLDGSVRLWQLNTGGARVLVEGDAIDNMEVHADRALVKTSGEVAWWNLSSGHRVPTFSWATDPRGLGVGLPSPDGELLIVPGSDLSVEIRRRTGPSMVLRNASIITAARFSPDSRALVTADIEGRVRRWNLATGENQLLEPGPAPVRSFAIAANGTIAMQAGDTAKLIAPDGSTRVLGTGSEWCWQFSEFEQVRGRLIMRRCDHSLAMLDGDRVIELPTGNFGVSRTAVSPDGTRVAAAMGDRTVRIWNAADGRVLEVLRGHTDLVMDVAFSPDGSRLASASYDKTIRVWALGTQRHRVLRGHTAAVNRITWRPTNDLVTASRDGTIRIWKVPSVELPTAAELSQRIMEATTARIDVDRPTTNLVRGT